MFCGFRIRRKKSKRQLQQEQSSKSSRSPSPEPAGAASSVPGDNGELFLPILRTPPPTRPAPPPSPPLPTHPVAPEPAAPLPLMPCAVCGRTFVPQSLAKHVKICEKMTIKKRKTFDSSRQRREGTDLEQYLPKNFGLPENSPFLEKSSPRASKSTPKPKPQSIRNPITKPMADLQRCPHCNRAFGVRAFERHVEWCADKAKILPVAPTQPPQHIADAKQRLNARTQYKAPPVRGRRSSQTRDKSSVSRSASVESSRGVSPPQPREYGDYRLGRTRASESVSSNDCHDETSPHMPVIRNSRNSQNSSSGDANVKARQARLARDLSSSRKKQDPRLSSVNHNNTDRNIKKIRKNNTELNTKKHQQSTADLNPKKNQQSSIDLNVKKIQQSSTDPNIKKSYQSNTDPNIKKNHQGNTDPITKKNQQSTADLNTKKKEQSSIDLNIKKIQQSSTDPNVKKGHQSNTDTNIEKSHLDNTDPNTRKSHQDNTDPNIRKNNQDNTDPNIKKSSQDNTDPNINKNQQCNTEQIIKKVQQSSTDPNIKKCLPQNKLKNKIDARKLQQLKKLEEMASKYRKKSQETIDDIKDPLKSSGDTPVSKKLNALKSKKHIDQLISEDIKEMNSPKINTDKVKNRSVKTPSEVSLTNKKNRVDKDNKIKSKTKKDAKKIVKENSMSLDSLEEYPTTAGSDRNCQSVGINTELLCVPCVIHENYEQKKANKKQKSNMKEGKNAENIISEPIIELLYKNPTILKSAEKQTEDRYERDSHVQQELINSNFDSSIATPSTSGNNVSDEIESKTDIYNRDILEVKLNLHIEENVETKVSNLNISESIRDSLSEKIDEEINYLSEEHFEENYEQDVSMELSNDSIENKPDDENITEINQIECRHGSGDTYTKYIEDPADLEEFMNITDKLLSNDHAEQECSSVAKVIDNFQTPNTSSIESINKQTSNVVITEPPKHNFSDTFEELKTNLRELLEGAGNTGSDALKKSDGPIEDKNSQIISDTNRNICDMEHITVYGLKFYEKKSDEEEPVEEVTPRFKLPSISESNKPGNKVECNKKRMQKIYKPNRKYKMLGQQTRSNKEYQTFIVNQNSNDNSDGQSVSSDAPPLKLPRIENRRLDDTYDPFVSAARQMKELMSSDTNIPKKIQTTKDHSRTLPALQPAKDKGPSSYLRSDNSKMMKDTLNKTYQKTPTLQRMKSFGSTNNENSSNTFGGRCSSFRLNRNDKKPSPKLNTTFTKSSKENISTVEKNHFNRNSNLNRSFSSYTASSYSTPKPKDKIPKIATSMYHSFQRTTIKQPVKLDKIKRDDEKKDFVNLDAILADDNSSMTDSNYIDPRLINENDNLPINVNTILNNPDIISSMESLLTTENLPKKFDSFSNVNQNNHKNFNNNITDISNKTFKNEPNNNVSKASAQTADDLSIQYDKIMYSLEQSIASKTSTRDDDSLCEDFDLEEFMTSFDEEIHKQKLENKRTCSSTTRIVKQSELADSNRTSELNSISSSPKVINGMNPVNKSMSLNFSSNNIVSENLFPSSVKRSTSLLDSIQKKNTLKMNSGKSRHKSDQLEIDLMQSLKDFDKFYENEKNENQSCKEITSYNGTAKRDSRATPDRKVKKIENIVNGNHTPNGKQSNDSAYSSLNRISPSKLSICTSKEPNGLTSLEQIPAGSDSSGSHKEDVRSISSDEFLAMERSAEIDDPLPPPDLVYKEQENHISEKRVSSRASSRRSPTWRAQGSRGSHGSLSSSGSEACLARRRESAPTPAPRVSRFCHECGNKFPVDTAKFCIECGVKRLVV